MLAHPSTRRARNLQKRRSPTSPVSPRMLAERHPCRSRITSPSHSQTSSAKTHLARDQIVSASVMQITDHVRAAPHSVGQRMRGLTIRWRIWKEAASGFP